jgi:hypothetical protein
MRSRKWLIGCAGYLPIIGILSYAYFGNGGSWFWLLGCLLFMGWKYVDRRWFGGMYSGKERPTDPSPESEINSERVAWRKAHPDVKD